MATPTTPRRTPGATWSAHGPAPLPAQGVPARGLARGPGRYEVGDLRQSRALERLARRVAVDGLAVFDGVHDAAGLRAAAARVMTVFPHPDADADGVTTITDLGPAGEHPGAAGFSHRGLPAHTDRSGVAVPPGLVMVTCAAGFFTGGASLLTDGAAVYTDLAATAPATLQALCRPRSVLFGGSAGYLGAVLTPDPAGVPPRCRLRLRLDDLATFSPYLDEHLPVLTAAIERHTIAITLTPGRGYLLDNHRWLHARRAYTGARTLFRLLGDPLPELGIHPGIPLHDELHDATDDVDDELDDVDELVDQLRGDQLPADEVDVREAR